jgi:TonB family protein
MFILLVAVGLFFLSLFLFPTIQSDLKQGLGPLVQEGKRILGLKKDEIPSEEKRIREQVILKRMEEASAQYDWRSLAPEYPRTKKLGPLDEKERLRALMDSKEFKTMEKELKTYLKKKEELFHPDPPIPPLKDATDLTHLEDKGAERIIEKLLTSKEKDPTDKPLMENIQLGIRGPLASRKIIERPPLPQVKLKLEMEIELTFWVLPNGIVDRIIPSVKGDMELERIAIQYLKQWRFVPLSKDQPQVEQWGTLPIKFKLR